jgi:serine/threonine protein kinase
MKMAFGQHGVTIMVIQAACPDPEVIRDLLNGSLPESEQSELSSHFDLCSTCQQAFDAEATGPQFLGDVARLCSDADWQQNTPTLDRLLRDIPQQLSDAADEASVATWSTEAVADFLDASENADHIGRLGTYEIVEVIGRGGMGIVLRGIDSRLNRVVAIKVLAPELASNPNARRRFYREGQAAAAVSHDHVVTIHAVDDHERLPYLVMEFVAGESLEECIRRTGALPIESVLRMGRQASLGLAAAHEVGLVHRDMKPANILLENGIQRVRITDFGLARATDDVSMTQTGTVTGTPLYMSPEQAGGEKIDHRSDLFSLGSVLYAMCTGRRFEHRQRSLSSSEFAKTRRDQSAK